MPQYLVTMDLPDNYDPSAESEETIEGIHVLNKEMIPAGVRKLLAAWPRRTRCGRSPTAIINEPYLETKEHVGGLSILESSVDKVLAWAREGR